MKLILGLLIAFTVGAACRYFDVPAPAPPAFQGALLVMAVSLGFISADKLIARNTPPPPAPIVAPLTPRADDSTAPPPPSSP